MKTKPTWYTDESDSTWERVKSAFKNDWEQTKNDFGADRARDLDQDVDNTVKQMLGKESTVRYGEMDYDDMDDAFKYGYLGRTHFGEKYPTWDDELRDNLRNDYQGDWKRDEPLIRYSYLRGASYR